MSYNFVNISSSKFSLNSREFFKTFLPISVGSTHMKIVNIYDNSGVLVPHTPVGDFLVDGIAYANSTDLSNAIYSVIFSKGSSESLDAQQVEANRLAIIALQNSDIDANHNHDSRYYTQLQVDSMIQSIVSSSDLLAKGEVDGDDVNFRKADNTLVFSIDAKAFLNQGTSITFVDGVLKLKNSKGETLSSTETDFLDLISSKLTQVNIQGALVETAGKTDLTQFEVGDKFTYWYENDTKYLIGKVKAIPISLPTDAEDKEKILTVYKGMI